MSARTLNEDRPGHGAASARSTTAHKIFGFIADPTRPSEAGARSGAATAHSAPASFAESAMRRSIRPGICADGCRSPQTSRRCGRGCCSGGSRHCRRRRNGGSAHDRCCRSPFARFCSAPRRGASTRRGSSHCRGASTGRGSSPRRCPSAKCRNPAGRPRPRACRATGGDQKSTDQLSATRWVHQQS